MIVTMAHGSGGRATSELIDEIFINEFDNVILSELEDSAVVEGNGRIAMTTDSFVVDPLKYNGGNIGRLAICGTVNDLLMRGATPKYITCGYIIEEGADTELLREVARSMAETAREAGVIIVAGDTKVIEGNGGMYINTAGVGFVEEGINISSKQCKKGDVIIVSGTLGEHHATILSSRMGIKNNIKSDNAPLTEMV
ncbi:MAG: hydrogenase expression/formation protein HypE, partial [Lachnospiraceae bacterium]|nr:hydrogenase expression/formation protein HypE [Lachnospiraceae bacterium]